MADGTGSVAQLKKILRDRLDPIECADLGASSDKIVDLALHPVTFQVWDGVQREADKFLQLSYGPVKGDELHLPLKLEMAIGRVIAPYLTLSANDMDLAVGLRLHAWGRVLDEHGRPQQSLPADCSIYMHYLSLGYWAKYNFPSVRLTPVQACALAMSDMTDDQVQAAILPWPACRLLFGDAFVAGEQPVLDTIVARWNSSPANRSLPSWHMAIRLGGGATLWQMGVSSTELFHGETRFLDELLAPDRYELRTISVVGRTIMNLCEVLDSKEGVLRPAKERRERGGKRRRVTGQGQAYELGLPVKVDMRQPLRDYLSKDAARIYKVRWVVRGHWRQQACGTGRVERRRRWIEPYWKGPEKGTRIVREHQVTDRVVGLPEENQDQ